MTPQRQLLLDLLAGQDDLDAGQLHQLASARDPQLSLPTVYRTLHTLEAAGVIVSRYLSSDHERRVYRVQQTTPEPRLHFTCQACGRVTPVRSDRVSALIEQLKTEISTGLDAEVASLCLCAGGVCTHCRGGDRMEDHLPVTLDQLTTGQSAIVRKIGGEGAVRRRLMDMGISRGIEIEMLKAAPMGDPVEYLVRGYHLSLRRSEAALVEIETSLKVEA